MLTATCSLAASAEIIDKEKKVRHSKLADRIEEMISDPTKMGVKLKVRAGGGWGVVKGIRKGGMRG